jgi:2-dehydropantoate 2-reductase
MKVLIFGAGGVGSVVGGFLARTGHDVSLLGRAWHLDVVEKQGLVITGIWGDYRMKAFDCFRNTEEIQRKKREFNLIILTVKSFDTAKAVDELLPLMREKTMLLSLQNGLGNVETVLEKGVKPESYLAGRVIFGAEVSPGVVKVTVNADDVRLGALPGVETKVGAFQIAQALNFAKIPTQAVPDIMTHIWSKVIYNCALNAICSLRQMPYGRILENEDTRETMKRVVRECYAVGARKGITLVPDDAESFIEYLVGTLIPSTAAHFPSMLQDLKRQKRTDIDALNGAICRYGKELGISTPENERLTIAIHEKEFNF